MSLKDFPNVVPDVTTTEGWRVFRNEVYGIFVRVERAARGKDEGCYSVHRPGALDSYVGVVRSRAQAAYAALWLEAAATDIGLGFHPDTRADDYEPPLRPDLAAQYDDMIGFCHGHLEDPYAIAYDAWDRAGLITSPKSV